MRGKFAIAVASSFFALMLITGSVVAEQRSLQTASYITLRGTDNDPWLSIPQGGGPLTGGDVRNASVFYIVKAVGSFGSEIHFGDRVEIRGIKGDPWLHVPKGGSSVVGGPPEDASIFVVEHPSDSSARNVIKIGDQFKIRGNDGDPWLRVPPSGGRVVGGSPPDASVFVVEDMNVPGKISETLEVTSPPSGPVQLGWTKIVPCSKLQGLKLKLGEQRIYAYADTSLQNISDAARSSVKDCAAVGVGACGLNSILATPGTCVPTFAGAFGSCMASKAPEVAVDGVDLFTQTKCLW